MKNYNELTIEQIEALSDEELIKARTTYGNREMHFLCAEGNDWNRERNEREANNDRIKASDNEIKKRGLAYEV